MSPTAVDTVDGWLPPREDLPQVVGYVLLVNVVGAVPVVLGGPGSEWFATLDKPWFYPPPATFGVVWTLLFSLLGVALYRVVRAGADGGDAPARADRREVRTALGLFVVQMALNVAWTPTFFGARSVEGGLAVIVALWVVLLPTVRAFDRVDRRAALLLVPYLAWVTFAAVLNAAILAMN